MELNWVNRESIRDMGPVRKRHRERVIASDKYGVRSALETRPEVCPKIIDRTYEIFVAGHDVGDAKSKESSEEPCAKEPFPGFLGGDFNKRRAAKSYSANIGKNVVGDDHGNGQEEPNQSFKNIVNDEVGLTDDEE